MNMRGKWTMFVGVDGYRVDLGAHRPRPGHGRPAVVGRRQGVVRLPAVRGGAATYCRVAIWRKGVPRPFVAVLPLSARIQPTSDSWKKDPNGMLAKCCEVLARRRAFPADMAVLDNTVEFDASDGNQPITRAEVPEGSWRAIEAPAQGEGNVTPQESERPEPVGNSSPSSVAEPTRDPAPASKPVPVGDVPELLNAIKERHGRHQARQRLPL
jgi:hypothetical protein